MALLNIVLHPMTFVGMIIVECKEFRLIGIDNNLTFLKNKKISKHHAGYKS